MATTTIGTIQLLATIDTSQYKAGAKEIEKTNDKVENSSDKTSSSISKGFNRAAKVGLAALATAAVAVGAAIVGNLNNAINRIDTLNNSQRVFQNMGFAVEDVDSAMEELVDGITGLPTSLDDAVGSVQQLAAANRDIGQAEDIYQALNNSVLAFGTGAASTESAVTAMARGLNSGVIQGQEFNTLMDNMGPVINQIADDMGLTTRELQTGLSDGTISVQEFTDELLRLNEDGSGSFASLEKQGKDATGGISTAFSNMNIAIQKGISDVVEEIGSENIANAISAIGTGLGNALRFAASAIKFMIDTWNDLLPVLQTVGEIIGNVLAPVWEILVKSFEDLWKALQPLLPALRIIGAIVLGVLIGAIVGFIAVLGIVISLAAQLVTGFVNALKGISDGFIVAYETVQSIWGSIVDWFTGLWNGVVAVTQAIFNGLASWFSGVIQVYINIFSAIGTFFVNMWNGAVNAVRGVFNGLIGFFQGFWNTIVGLFGRIGSAIGDTIGGAVRGAINAVLGGAVNIINGFIDAINGAIDAVRALPGLQGIGRLDRLNVPQLANGGIVPATPGGILANLGEGREDEAVIPLSRLDDMLSQPSSDTGNGREVVINQENNVYTELDMRQVNRNLTWELARS